MQQVDMYYINKGMFVSFIPNTPEAEDCWRLMATNQDGDFTTCFPKQADSIIRQLRKAGYKVAKAPKSTPPSDKEIDDLLNELTA